MEKCNYIAKKQRICQNPHPRYRYPIKLQRDTFFLELSLAILIANIISISLLMGGKNKYLNKRSGEFMFV